jgi:hypothetical protein
MSFLEKLPGIERFGASKVAAKEAHRKAVDQIIGNFISTVGVSLYYISRQHTLGV